MAEVYNSNSNTVITGTAYSDFISNVGSNVTINTEDSYDKIVNDGDSVKIDGGAGGDSICNSGDSVKIDAGAGDDKTDNGGNNSTILAGTGDDDISNSGDSVTIDSGAGGDDIRNGGSSVSINAGTGNDHIENTGSDSVKIDAGAGDDYIKNYGDSVTIDAGAGDDRISLCDSLVSKNTKNRSKHTKIQYALGDGNDTIYNFDSNDTIQITSGTYSTLKSGNNFIIAVGNGSIVLEDVLSDFYNKIHIQDSKGVVKTYNDWSLMSGNSTDDYLSNTNHNVTIDAGAGNDSIRNNGDSVTIDSGDGNDYISNSGDSVSIDAGVGNDSIDNYYGDSVSIDAGAGSDDIRNWGSSVSINTGAGNDYIDNYRSVVTIDAGDGDDDIYNSGDSVTIDSGDGNDYISISGDSVSIDAGVGNDSIDNYYGDSVSINAGVGDDSIYNYGDSVTINAGAGNDYIGNNGNSVTIDAGAGDDRISLYRSFLSKNTKIRYALGDGNDTIYNFDSDDTIQITSGTYSTLKSENNFIIAVGNGSIVLEDVLSDFYNKIHIQDSKGVVKTYNDWNLMSGNSTEDYLSNTSHNITIDAGAGNDYISNSGDSVSIDAGVGNDSIYNYYGDSVSIDAGAGNDSIYNYYGSNVTISGGAGNDYIYNHYGDSVSIDAGAGNDYISNHYGDSVSIDAGAGDDDISNSGDSVTIDSGAGNDFIYNFGSSVTINAGVGDDSIRFNGNSNLGSDDVIINGGSGDDYISIKNSRNITVFAGDGNDTIDNSYNFYYKNSMAVYTSSVYSIRDRFCLAVGNYTSIYSGNDILIKTKNGSVLLKNAKNAYWNPYINILPAEDSGGGNITQTGGSDNIENTLDNRTVYGTNAADALYNNGGNNVLIYGLAGDDKIGNIYTAKEENGSVIAYCGENVSLNGGKGNDEVYSFSSKDHIIYASGDGDDTIFAYYSENDFKNGGSLKIHLTSGTFKGAKLDSRYHSNLVISLGNGTITLKTSNGLAANKIPITIIDSNGEEFKFTGEYEVKIFAYSATAGETHTATQHNSYSGELVTGKNGEAFIEKGDTIKTDSSGNISEIIISNKNHKITTPLNRSTQKNVVVKDSTGNTIATIKYGIAEIYWDGNGYVIDTVDKDAPISVESNMDNVKIIGSNRADNITNNGKNSIIDSGLGNDTVTNNNSTSTIIGGKDNDTINGYGENIKLTVGSVKNASLKGSDVIITTSRDSVITVKNGKGKNINVVTGKDKNLQFTLSNASDTYGDPEVFMEEAESLANMARNELEQEVAGILETTASTTNKEALDNLKKCFAMVPASKSTLSEIPDSVFNQIVNDIYNRTNASKIKTFNILKPETWVYTVAESVSTLGAKEISFGGYNISINSLIALGAGEAYITVTNGSKKWEITYQSSKEQLTEAIANYAMVLNKLNQDAWWNVVTGLLTDITGTKKAGKYLTYAKNIVSALVEPNGKLSDEIKSVVKKETNLTIDGTALRDFIKNYVPSPYNDIILEAADAYKEISLLQSNITADKSFKENADVYDDLNIAYSAFKVALNGTKVSAPQISSFSFSGLFSALGSSAIENINDNQITYVDSSGETVSSATNAIGKFETDNESLIYTPINSEEQDINLGSMFDTNDWIINTSDKSDKIITASNKNATVISGKGDDSVIVSGMGDVFIEAGSGDDVVRIANSAQSIMTVNGGLGNDSIYSNNASNVFVYQNGDGDDVIYEYSAYNEIQISGSSYSTTTNGEDVIIQVGNGSINLVDAKNKSLNIKGNISSGEDTLPAGISINNSILTASNNFTGNKIDLADYPTVTKVDASSISNGISIVASSAANSIKGGSGADTISGGAGNDTVSLGSGSDVYIYSSGSDLIQDYTVEQDKIKLSSGSILSASVSNSNVILNISNGGKLTIQNGKDKEISFIDSSGKESKQVYHSNDKPEPTDSLPTGMSIKSSILTASNKFTGKKIDLAEYPTAMKVNASAVSQALTISGNSLANSLKSGKGADTISGGSGNDTLAGGTGKDVFVYSSGNDVVTDYKVNEDKIKIGEITNSTVKGSDVILTTSKGNLTVKGAKDKVITFVDNNGNTIDKVFYGNTSYSPLATGLTYDSKRIVLTASNKYTGNKINLGEYLGTVTKVNAATLSKGLNVVGNTTNNSIKGGKGADTISGGAGKDTMLGGNGNDKIYGGSDNDVLRGDAGNDTLYGGTSNDTLTGGKGNDVFVHEGGNDVITDYFTGENTIKLTSGSVISASVKSSDVVLKTSAGSVTIKKGSGKKITVTDGNGNTATEYYGLVNYSADKKTITLSSALNTSLKAEDYATTVTKIDASAIAKSINIVGNAQNNTMLGSSKAETIYGGPGNDSIFGNAGNDKIYGDAGADSLNGGKGNDTLTGGDGNDVFFYASGEGNDVIADFTVGQDKINITSGTIASASLKSSDMVFKIGNGTLTVKNGKNKEIAIGSSIYYNDLIYDTSKTAVTLGASFSGSLKSSDYATTTKTINAVNVVKSINIIGNSQDNTVIGSAKAETIYGGSGNDSIIGNAGNDKIYGDAGNDKLFGGEGNDTLNGGASNDTLTGGNGKDVFVHEGGNDVITDYTAGQDTIKINSGTITKTSYSGNNVVFNVGSGSITIQNGKGKKIAIIDSNNKTTTQTYNQDVSYVAAKTKSNARWFTADDNNFITDENQLSAITKVTDSNYAVGQTEIFPNTNEFAITDSIVSATSFDKK